MFGKILVPIDGSTEAIAATRYARKIAEKFSSAVTLIHIVQHAAYIESDSPSMSSSIITRLNERADEVLAQALEIFEDFGSSNNMHRIWSSRHENNGNQQGKKLFVNHYGTTRYE